MDENELKAFRGKSREELMEENFYMNREIKRLKYENEVLKKMMDNAGHIKNKKPEKKHDEKNSEKLPPKSIV